MRKKILLYLLLLAFSIAATLAVIKDQVNAPGSTDSGQSGNQSQTIVPTFDKQKHSVTDPLSPWVVINKSRPLDPLTYAPSDLTSIGGQQLRKEAAGALSQMIATAKSASLTIQPLSGYRSYTRQQTVYKNEVAANGQAVADTQSAKPGYSEHQTGWSIDIGGGGCGIEDCFGNTKEGRWVAANAYKYGFIVRYVSGKESVTGYRAEPWHIRYVGTELANELHNQNISTLEEFFGL